MSDQNNKGFSLYYRNGYAVLRVFPPRSPEDRVFPEEVANRMKLLQIPMVRMKILEDIIERADGRRVKLVEWPGGAHLSPVINLRVLDDGMLAEVLIEPPRIGGGEVTKEQFEYTLKDSGINAGIDWNAIMKSIDHEYYNRWFTIARGNPPIHGKGGRVKYHFSTERGKAL